MRLLRKIQLLEHALTMAVMPKFYLKGPYEVLEEAEQYSNIINTQNLAVNWQNLMDYKK